MDMNKIWEIVEEWESSGFEPIKECIGWLSNDDRVDIYNTYNDTTYSVNDNGMELILEEVEAFENGREWIYRTFKWIGSYEGGQLVEFIEGLYN